MSGTIIPSNVDAERALLSAITYDPDLLPEVRNAISENDFYLERNQSFFKVLCKLYDDGMPFDTYLFMDEVEKQKLTAMVDVLYFTEVVGLSIPSFHAMYYVESVKEASKKRKYWKFAQDIVSKLHAGESTEEIEKWMDSEKGAVERKASDGLMTWDDSFDYEDRLIEMYKTPGHLAELDKWTMPWDSWSKFIDPAEKGVLINIAGPDGVGKTVCGEMFAEHWARNGLNGVYVHFELDRKIMIERRLCRYGSVSRRKMVSNSLNALENKKLEAARNFVRTWPGKIHYLHANGWTMEQVISRLKYLQHKGMCDFVVIDYLEKARASTLQMKLFNSQYQREADDVELVKRFSESEEHGCRAVVLSQLGKEGKQTPFSQLTRDKIRGAGEKTERVNVVVLLHKEINLAGVKGEDGNYTVEPGGYDLDLGVIIDKNTLGKTARFNDRQQTTEFFSIHDKP